MSTGVGVEDVTVIKFSVNVTAKHTIGGMVENAHIEN